MTTDRTGTWSDAGEPPASADPTVPVVLGAYVLEVGGHAGTLVTAGGSSITSPTPPVQTTSTRGVSSAIAAAERSAALLDEATSRVEQAEVIFEEIASGRADATAASATADALLDLIARLDQAGDVSEAIRVGRVASQLLALSARWIELAETLENILEKAERVNDGAAIGWAKHELGTIHLAMGNLSEASSLLDGAYGDRVRLGDQLGLKATLHNLSTLCQTLRGMVRNGQLVHARRSRHGRREAVLVSAAASLLIIGVLVGAAFARSAHHSAALVSASLAAHPAHLTFLGRAVGTSAPTRTIKIVNIGTAPTTLAVPQLSATANTEFKITDLTCARILAPRQACLLQITYFGGRGPTPAARLILAYLGTHSPLRVLLRIVASRPASPVAQTGTAGSVSQTEAMLQGSVNPNGSAVLNCKFEYGTTTEYDQSTRCAQLVGGGSGSVSVSAVITGLDPRVTYHFKLVATNAAGTSSGADQTFTTEQPLPSVTTLAASAISQTLATLQGSVNPNASTVSNCKFEYGTTIALSQSQSAPCSQPVGDGSEAVPVSVVLTGLAPDTTYYYALQATNGGGLSTGTIETFTTAQNIS